MSKKQWIKYLNKDVSRKQCLKTNKKISYFLFDYITNRENELVDKFSAKSTDDQGLANCISKLILLTAWGESRILAANTIAKGKQFSDKHVRDNLIGTTDQYIDEVISVNNQALNKHK